MNFKPLGERVLVERLEENTTTASESLSLIMRKKSHLKGL